MLLFSHLLYYSSAQHFSELLWTKSFSFGRCDQELRTKCRKMVKNEGAQNWFEPERPNRARLPDSGAVNGSKNGLRMQKLFKFEDFSISIKKMPNLPLWKNFIKKKIFHRIFWEYSVEYSAEYSGEYSLAANQEAPRG